MFDATLKLPEERGSNDLSNHKGMVAISFAHSNKELRGLINILVDPEISLDDQYTLLWIWGSNCDPIRDSRFEGDLLEKFYVSF